MALSLIRFLKITYIRLGLHRVFGFLNKFFLNMVYLSRLSRWASSHKALAINDFASRWDYQKRYPFYEAVLTAENLMEQPVQYLEFGVATGASFRWFLDKNRHPESRFTGFDTFTGLPEDFGSYKKGAFATGNQVPVIDDPRGSFRQGLFQQTLPGFLNRFDNRYRTILMMDADLYSATLYVLGSMAPYLKAGDIVFFDEFAVPTHEFKAFDDFMQSFPIKLELIGAANNYYFTAFRVAGNG